MTPPQDPLTVTVEERASLALAESRPKNKHGQLCPVWARRNVSRGRAPTIEQCDCWILADARRDTSTVLAAALRAAPAEAETAVDVLLAAFDKECEDALDVGIRPTGGDELKAWNYVVNHFRQVFPLIVSEWRAATEPADGLPLGHPDTWPGGTMHMPAEPQPAPKPEAAEDKFADAGSRVYRGTHKPVGNGLCEHRWRNRTTVQVHCGWAEGYAAGRAATEPADAAEAVADIVRQAAVAGTLPVSPDKVYLSRTEPTDGLRTAEGDLWTVHMDAEPPRTLDEAWKAAEAALPDGWGGLLVGSRGASVLDANGNRVQREGSSPAAALWALAAALNPASPAIAARDGGEI